MFPAIWAYHRCQLKKYSIKFNMYISLVYIIIILYYLCDYFMNKMNIFEIKFKVKCSNFFQIDLIGQSIYEFAHLCDQAELKEILTNKDVGVPKSFFIRMKCTLTSKGRNVNLKSASYKVCVIYF